MKFSAHIQNSKGSHQVLLKTGDPEYFTHRDAGSAEQHPGGQALRRSFPHLNPLLFGNLSFLEVPSHESGER